MATDEDEESERIATLAQKKGTVKDIQGVLRHSRIATTTDVYMQEIPESVQKTVDAISAELRLLPNLEEVTRGTSVLLPNWQAGYRPVVEKMVDLVGIEPTTSSMPWKRAPSCATGPLFSFSLSWAAASNSTPAANLN